MFVFYDTPLRWEINCLLRFSGYARTLWRSGPGWGIDPGFGGSSGDVFVEVSDRVAVPFHLKLSTMELS